MTSYFELNNTCTCVGLSLGINVPLFGVIVNSSSGFRQLSVGSKAKLKPISYLPLFFKERDCFVSKKTPRVPKSRPPSAPKEIKDSMHEMHAS